MVTPAPTSTYTSVTLANCSCVAMTWYEDTAVSEFRNDTTGACQVSVADLLPMPETCRFVGGSGGTVRTTHIFIIFLQMLLE